MSYMYSEFVSQEGSRKKLKLYLLFYFMQLEDTLWQGLTDFYAKMPMGVTGENLAEKYNITRQDCDELALLSQKRWAEGKKTAGDT